VNGMTCKIELAQLQTQIYDLQDELPKARALWAAERDGLVRQCIRPSEGLPDASTEFVEPDVAGVSCKDKLSQLQAEMDDLAGELPKARKEWEVERERLLHQCSRPSEVPPESSTSATMVLQAPDASSIVEPKTSSEPCVVELAQLRTQFEDLVEELPKARREWAAERGRLRAECVAERESALQQCSRPYEATNAEAMEIEEAVPVVETTSPSGHPILQVNGEGVSPSGGSTGWPNCVERGIVLRGHNMYSIFVDVTAQLGDAASGCYMGNCASSDKFVASKSEDCARMCGVFPSCKFWTFGEQDGQRLCFLRGGDGGREDAAEFVAGAKDCRPPPTKVLPAQAALAVLDSADLRACESDNVCNDLRDAMRTWRYGIENLRLALEGSQHNLDEYLVQIASDGDEFLQWTDKEMPGQTAITQFRIAVDNNRQVFGIARDFLAAQQPATPVDRMDASLPPPARGLLCRGQCVQVPLSSSS